ncbi:MAG: hypothetical protein FWF79_08295 [Defluviitaleaceae bacterium]|nr:hypothetical protein [Defluviitaleaceae bacterium]
MKCKKAEKFFMQYFEKKIEPKNAIKLAKHIKTCENCRELYLVFDEAAVFNENPGQKLEPVPQNFTDSVMAAISADAKNAAYGKAKSLAQMIFGGAAIIFGLLLAFVFEPVVGAFSGAGLFMRDVAERFSQSDALLSVENMGVVALLFVAIPGILLYILQNGERINT